MHHVDRDLVLGAVLGRGQQVLGGAAVRGRLARPRRRPGHRLGPHHVPGPRHEELGARADVAVDQVGQGVRRRLDEPGQHGRRVDRAGRLDRELPGQHHLRERARCDRPRGLRHPGAPHLRVDDGRRADLGRERGGSAVGRVVRTVGVDHGGPHRAVPVAADQPARDDECGRRVPVVGECGERHRPTTRRRGPVGVDRRRCVVDRTDAAEHGVDDRDMVGPRGGDLDPQRRAGTPQREVGGDDGHVGRCGHRDRSRRGDGGRTHRRDQTRVAVISCAIPPVSSVRRTWSNPESATIATSSAGSGRYATERGR